MLPTKGFVHKPLPPRKLIPYSQLPIRKQAKLSKGYKHLDHDVLCATYGQSVYPLDELVPAPDWAEGYDLIYPTVLPRSVVVKLLNDDCYQIALVSFKSR